ncbi:GyrI-like domain-containing protein [Anatilimnocola sp. NA78]|uniref:GyrI-like domain-containing protein n=1 Tax=Anatilimnocola sp. NA78 TaxID=3415683 RepID=UPI003CE4C3EF
MKVVVFVKATKSSEAGEFPPEPQFSQLMAEMSAYNEELVKAGIMLGGGEGLQPTSKAVRVHFSGKNRTVTDGPFTETKEIVAGFWLWRVKSMEEAIEWVKKCPNPMLEDSDIDIRPIYEADDFGEAFSPALREQEAAQRAVVLGLNAPQFVDAEALLIAGLNRNYTMENRSEIPGQWEAFGPHIGTTPGKVGTASYGVSWNVKNNSSFDYLTGVQVQSNAELPSDFTKVSLPARRYAVFSHTQSVKKLPQTIDTIWDQWAPDSGLKIAQSPCVERYTADFCPDGKGMEIWIPLEA